MNRTFLHFLTVCGGGNYLQLVRWSSFFAYYHHASFYKFVDFAWYRWSLEEIPEERSTLDCSIPYK